MVLAVNNSKIDMLIIRNIAQILTVKFHSNYSSKRNKSIDMAYITYENVKTPNDKPPLIIMHGLFGSKQNWRSIGKELLKKLQNRKIILVDARNHGESPHTTEHRYVDMAEDIAQLLKKESLKRACLMGHSMGGRCMMYTALKYPHLIEKAIIVDISPFRSSNSLENMAFIINALQKVHVSNKLEIKIAKKEAYKQLKNLNIRNSDLRNFLLTNFMYDPDRGYRWRFNLDGIGNNFASHILTFPEDAVHLKYLGPILFIGGAVSDSIDETHLAKIQNLYFPSAQLIMLPNAGHLIHVDQPDVLIDLVVKFLQ